MKHFGPILVPLLTPEKRDDFFPLIDHVLQGGIEDLILFGTTGEGLNIDHEEKKALIQKIQPYVGKRARLSIGLLSNSLSEAIDLANFSYAQGFQSALFPPMLYGEDAVSIVHELLAHTKIPVFLYNPPTFIAKSIPDISPFVNEPQIVGMKDSVIEPAKVASLVSRFRKPTFRIYLGRESDLEEVFQSEIDGLVPGSANVYPNLFVRVWKKRDPETLNELKEAKAYLTNLCPDNYIESLKMALQKLKIAC